MNTTLRRGRRALSALVALLLVAVSLVGLSSTAMAAPAPGQTGAPTTGSLTIHKYAGTATNQANNGSLLPTAPNRTPLAGVQFTVYPVTAINGTAVNLNTAAGWDAVAAYQKTPPLAADLSLGAGTVMTTGADGTISRSGMPIGLYFVQETSTGSHNVPEVGRTADFLVTLPMPQSDAGWNYDVHVYPKNTVTGQAAKTVNDTTAVGAGDNVTWTVNSPSLSFGNVGRPLTSFVMRDTLSTNLRFDPSTVRVRIGTETLPSTYYTISHPGGTGGELVISLTAAGLANVSGRPAESVVSFDFGTAVVGIGQISNTATVSWSDGTTTEDYVTPPATTPWGAVVINKQDSQNSARLSGAVFQVFTTADASGTPVAVEVGGTRTTNFTTAADGSVTIPGLKAGTYYLKEITAPAGYVLDSTVIRVDVVAGATSETSTVTIPVSNTRQTVPQLPFTGANGQLMMTAGGAALLLLAGGLALMKRRRSENV